jgi:aminoglycoside phosphotransferase (APT) family kinase protein
VDQGVDAAAVTAWLVAELPGTVPPLRFEPIVGGQSNLTYRVVDAAGAVVVLRRPPLHGVLASAHDMAREHRILRGLLATAVPAPRPLALCEDPAVTGAPFYVMEHVEGIVPRDEPTVAAAFDEPARAAASGSLVDALVGLHAVDPDEVGLGQLGRKEGYLERQLGRWQRQLEQSRTRELPSLDEVHRRLAAAVPAQVGPARLVHGDYRLDNLVLSPAGDVRAVLDWELCTLGDPLADVGLLLVYWRERGEGTGPLGRAPSTLPGFPSRAELAGAYAERSGRDLDRLDYYVAFGYWKLAAILEGVYARFQSGAYGSSPDQRWRELGESVVELAQLALEAAGRAGR